MSVLLFLVLGFGVAIIGTLVGVGGGFLLVPVLTVAESHWSPQVVTAFSLAVITANALSGTLAYWRQGRIDGWTLRRFALVAAPGAIVGVFLGDRLAHGLFIHLFAVLLLIMAGLLLVTKRRFGRGVGSTQRRLVDAQGRSYQWAFDLRIALLGVFAVGIASALFGIGGGPIMVPFLIAILSFPEHLATASSHGVLLITSLLAVLIHLVQGDYAHDTVPLAATMLGALLGAPIGARLSQRVSGSLLLRILAMLLAIVGVEMWLR